MSAARRSRRRSSIGALSGISTVTLVSYCRPIDCCAASIVMPACSGPSSIGPGGAPQIIEAQHGGLVVRRWIDGITNAEQHGPGRILIEHLPGQLAEARR